MRVGSPFTCSCHAGRQLQVQAQAALLGAVLERLDTAGDQLAEVEVDVLQLQRRVRCARNRGCR
jgi:hypothetical protein